MQDRAPFEMNLRSPLEVEDTKSTVRASAGESMHTARKTIHIAYHTMLPDNATPTTANPLLSTPLLLTQTFEMGILPPVERGELKSEERSPEKRTDTIATRELFDDAGSLNIRGTGRFRRLRIMLESVPGNTED